MTDIYDLVYDIMRQCGINEFDDPPRWEGTKDALIETIRRFLKDNGYEK